MKINSATASFGKLENESLTFHDGLNVIYAPNESGKSTWCAFIRAMLYGIDTSERAKAGFMPDKTKYMPWSGAPMSGTMELTADGCSITLSRSTRSSAAPMREFSATYTGTANPVEGINGTNCGEMLTGVSAGVFRRTAFVEQGSIAVTGSSELEKRIAAIISSGDESISYSDADSELKGWLRKRRSNKKGMLPELEEKMDDIERKLEGLEGSSVNAAELEARLEQARDDCSRLENEMNECRKIQRRNAISRMQNGRTAVKQARDAHELTIEKLADAKSELGDSYYGMRKYSEIRDAADKDIGMINTYLHIPAAKPVFIVLAALMLVLSAVFATILLNSSSIIPAILATVSLVLGIVFMLLYLNKKQSYEKAGAMIERILKRNNVSGIEELEERVEKHRLLSEAVREAIRKESEARLAVQDAEIEQSRIEDHALGDLDFADGDSTAARLGRELAAARRRVEELSSEIASLSGKNAVLGDPMALKSELCAMEDRHTVLEQECEAINLAIDTLRDADSELQKRFSPELGRLASSYMARMTGGRYKNVLIDRDFSAMTRTDDDSVARRSEFLSAGTLDLMYLAVRLAVCELALPQGEPCPLVIDDALVNLDDARCEQAMELLREIGSTRQVILFTCRPLEKNGAI